MEDDHSARSAPRSRRGAPQETSPSHGDILRAVEGIQNNVNILIMDVKAVKAEIAAVVKCLGKEDEDEHGNPYGTGLVGRHMRLQVKVDKRFRLYDDWRNYAVAAFMTASLFLAVIWWLIETRLEQVLL